MDIPDLSKVKEEPNNETYPYVPTRTTSESLIGFFLDSNYSNRDEIGYFYGKTKYLDDTDGKFKYYTDLSSNVRKSSLDGDYKNYCEKCNKQFSNSLAIQRHYMFTHDTSLLMTSVMGIISTITPKMESNRKEDSQSKTSTIGKISVISPETLSNTKEDTLLKTSTMETSSTITPKTVSNRKGDPLSKTTTIGTISVISPKAMCNKKADTLLKTSAMETISTIPPKTVSNKKIKTKEYNWLDEPLPTPPPPQKKSVSDCPNIIMLKGEKANDRKLYLTDQLVHATEQSPQKVKKFTIENIKRNPQVGIRVVKKSEIKFDQLKDRAEQQLLLSFGCKHEVYSKYCSLPGSYGPYKKKPKF